MEKKKGGMGPNSSIGHLSSSGNKEKLLFNNEATQLVSKTHHNP